MSDAGQAAPSALSDLTGTWSLDPGRTTVRFQTKAMWVLNVKGSLRAKEGSGTVDEHGQVTGRLVLDAGSVDTGNKRRDDHLRTADFLDVDHYPELVFSVENAELGSPGQGRIQGELSVHGTARPLDLQASVRSADAGAVVVEVDTVIDRSQWGMSWAKMGAGLVNQVHVEAVFVRG